MRFFRPKETTPAAPPVVHLPVWECAKQITEDESRRKDLPMGWYIWKKGYRFFAMKPNETNTEFERSYDFHTPEDAQTWLGIPVPEEMTRKPEGPSWEEKLAEVKAQAEKEREARHAEQARLAQEQQEDAEDGKESRRKRPREAHIRFTEAEFAVLQDRVEESCLPQSVFMRQAVLTGQVLADPHRETMITEMRNLNAELRGLRGDLGKLGGLLKMTIKPNEAQKTLDPENWALLLNTVHTLFHLQKDVEKVMVKLNGCLDHEFQ